MILTQFLQEQNQRMIKLREIISQEMAVEGNKFIYNIYPEEREKEIDRRVMVKLLTDQTKE